MRCWNSSSKCAWFIAISIYITTMTKQAGSHFLSDIFSFSLFPWDFCVVQTGVCSSQWQCENWFGTAFAECWLQCTLNEASGRCTGFEQSPIGNVWPQVFICYVGRPTGECEAHIIFRGTRLLFYAVEILPASSLCQSHNHVYHIALLLFLLPPCSFPISTRVVKDLSHSTSYMQFQGTLYEGTV